MRFFPLEFLSHVIYIRNHQEHLVMKIASLALVQNQRSLRDPGGTLKNHKKKVDRFNRAEGVGFYLRASSHEVWFEF